MDMIDTNYLPVSLAPTVPQLRGPWAIARGQEPILPPAARTILTLSSAAASAFHGVRRNGGSIFWGVWWFALGAIFPVITPIVGVAQGYGKPRRCTIGSTLGSTRATRRRWSKKG